MVCGTQQDSSHSIREDRVKFFVHKGGVKGLDCIASDQSRPGFYKFSFHHVLHFATVLWASWPIAHFNCEAVWIWKIVVVHGVCCAWLWDRLFGRRGHRREEHEGGGGAGTRGFDTRAGRSVVCKLCLPLIADTVSMLWTLKDNIWEGEPSAHFLNHGPLASFTCAHGYRHGHLRPMPVPIF